MNSTFRHKSKFLLCFCRNAILVGIVAAILIVFSAGSGVLAMGGNKVFEEGEVKAVFLYNLTKFVVWPEEIKDGEKPGFSIAIIGSDPFGSHLDEVISSETVKGRKITLRRYRDVQEVPWQNIDLLYIGSEMAAYLPELTTAARHFKVLTVGDFVGFCQAGGMVNLLTIDNRIKIEVNIEETRKSEFLVSAKVLNLARIITTTMESDQ